jgi:hypothetical protein
MKPTLLALLTAVALAATGCGAGVHATGEPRPDPNGPRLAGQVLVVAISGGVVTICGDQTSDLMFGPPGCTGGPQAVGLEASALPDHSSRPAERWGYLYLVGRYRSGKFYVTSHGMHGPPNRTVGTNFSRPPCPAPQGGWHASMPTQSQRATVDHYSKLAHHHDLVDIAFFKRGSVLTVASSDPARTRAVLSPYWPRQLCVVKARYSRALLVHEGAKMVALLKQPSSTAAAAFGWPSGGGGTAVSDRGQPMTNLNVLLVTPQLRAYLQKQPPGLVQVQATLNPLQRI